MKSLSRKSSIARWSVAGSGSGSGTAVHLFAGRGSEGRLSAGSSGRLTPSGAGTPVIASAVPRASATAEVSAELCISTSPVN